METRGRGAGMFYIRPGSADLYSMDNGMIGIQLKGGSVGIYCATKLEN